MAGILKILYLTILAMALSASAVFAQLRSIPADAKRGLMHHVQETTVEVNGRPMRLAPAAQIRDAMNRIVMPATVPSGSLVKFTLDAQGQLRRVWILTADEAAQPDPRQ